VTGAGDAPDAGSGSAGDAGAPVRPLAPATLAAIRDAAGAAVERGDVPGAVVAVVRAGGVAFLEAYGVRRVGPSREPLRVDAVFDLASLTKAIATAPCIHILAEQGKLALDAPAARYLPAFGANGKTAITVEQLLLHTSGLPADNALAEYRGGRADALARVDASRASDPGSRFEYSDLGYIVLGQLIERVSGTPLDAFAHEHLFRPLGMNDSSFVPGAALRARAVPTEMRAGDLLEGTVHDPRAAALEGVAGHAGLFSTAADLARFAAMLLAGGKAGDTVVLAPSTMRRMVEPHAVPGGSLRALGWDVRSSFSGARGELRGFGHTGFTGTSIWIDPDADVAVIVLTSQRHPDGKGDARRLRREIATAVARGARAEAQGPLAASSRVTASKVLTGIDVLERDGFAALRGRRVGLVTNASGVDATGSRTVDVLRAARDVTLVKLFSPEHGLRTSEDSAVADDRDAATGLPIYSLYGQRQRPTDAQLRDLDTLVFDLADAGARWFTFETTLGYLLEAAAAHHLRVVVLDRPNPIGGAVVEGPVLDAGRTSFIAYHPIPIRHGMTLGELAQLWNRERSLGTDLQVVRLEGWHRADLLDATGVAWVNPSPNLRNLDAALLYPGVALLEATNVSVGRGTARPFEQLGAPWIDGPRLAAALEALHLPGVSFSATTFTPTSSTHATQRCGGVALAITDRAALRPVRVGLAIARTLRELHGKEWKGGPVAMMLGHASTFDALLRGDGLEAIAASWDRELAAFGALRRRYLLYPE
jgi:uncharacterized protein YbbC (DUF1343 family)/CubicO group peptidase (beta-lactamase class C family)